MLIFKMQKHIFRLIWLFLFVSLFSIPALLLIPLNKVINVTGVIENERDYTIFSKVDGYIENVTVSNWEKVTKKQEVLKLYNNEVHIQVYEEYTHLLRKLDECLPLNHISEREKILEDLYNNLNNYEIRNYDKSLYEIIMLDPQKNIFSLLSHEQSSLKIAYEAEQKASRRAAWLYKNNKISLEEYEESKKSYELKKAGYFNTLKKVLTDYNLTKLKFFKSVEELHSLTLYSPADGFIDFENQNWTPGTYVKKGDPLFKVRNNKNIFIIHIPERYIETIKKQQEVIIYLNAYNYKKYGVITGKLDKIAPGLVIQNGETFLKCSVKVGLDKTVNEVVFKPGMSYAAKINTGNKKIYQFVLDSLLGN